MAKNIKKESPEWEMMKELFNLYDFYLGCGTEREDQAVLSDKQNHFELKYKTVPLTKEFSEAISSHYLKRLELLK